MLPSYGNPHVGQWFLSVTCERCDRRVLLFPDLNNGRGSIQAFFNVTCPNCKIKQTLPAEHYHQHRELVINDQ